MSTKWIWLVKANDERRVAWREAKVKTAAQAGKELREAEAELKELLKTAPPSTPQQRHRHEVRVRGRKAKRRDFLYGLIEELQAIVAPQETVEIWYRYPGQEAKRKVLVRPSRAFEVLLNNLDDGAAEYRFRSLCPECKNPLEGEGECVVCLRRAQRERINELTEQVAWHQTQVAVCCNFDRRRQLKKTLDQLKAEREELVAVVASYENRST